MDTTDTLQLKIQNARGNLPEMSREAMDAINFRSTILGLSGGYTSDQLEILETETELLLCGLLTTENYPKEVETRMGISKSQVDALLSELDRSVFKKIQEILIKKVAEQEPVVFDAKFSSLPENIQEAIARSNWQKKLYAIGTKNKLSIDKMATLEESTVGLIAGEISPSIYEGKIFQILSELDKESLKGVINEINTTIMKVIRGFEQEQTKQEENRTLNETDEVPIPPYAPIPAPVKIRETVSDVYKDAGVEIVKDQKSELPKNEEEGVSGTEDSILRRSGIKLIGEVPVASPEHLLANMETKKRLLEGVEHPVNAATSIIGDKLSGVVKSIPQVSDHSLPKISPEPSPEKSHDPYHESIS
jgi:hypothetical protein